jgi:molybdopterin synthase catalytic subunit
VGALLHENRGQEILRLEYEAYEEMAPPPMEEIAARTQSTWPSRRAPGELDLEIVVDTDPRTALS